MDRYSEERKRFWRRYRLVKYMLRHTGLVHSVREKILYQTTAFRKSAEDRRNYPVAVQTVEKE